MKRRTILGLLGLAAILGLPLVGMIARWYRGHQAANSRLAVFAAETDDMMLSALDEQSQVVDAKTCASNSATGVASGPALLHAFRWREIDPRIAVYWSAPESDTVFSIACSMKDGQPRVIDRQRLRVQTVGPSCRSGWAIHRAVFIWREACGSTVYQSNASVAVNGAKGSWGTLTVEDL